MKKQCPTQLIPIGCDGGGDNAVKVVAISDDDGGNDDGNDNDNDDGRLSGTDTGAK